MIELELNAQADDQKLLAQVIDFYQRALKESPEALGFLRKRGISKGIEGMKCDEGSDDGESNVIPITDFTLAQFPSELGLPRAEEAIFTDAKTMVRQEFRDCSKWKRMRCRKVSVIAERDRRTIYAVHVGSAVEFDWTWEGAVAFRPQHSAMTGRQHRHGRL